MHSSHRCRAAHAPALDVIHCSSFCLGAAPTWREASSPFLNSISVGIDMMPYLAAVCGFSSTFSLTILTLPLSEPAISSSAGAIMRQGPHHSAQKSTTTGSALLSTSVSKVESDTFVTPMAYLYLAEIPRLFACRESLASRMRTERMEASPKRQGLCGYGCGLPSTTLDRALSSAAAGSSIRVGPSVHTSAARTCRPG